MAASEPTGILEIVPLPSKPHVKLGELEKMAQLEQLLIEKNQPRPPSPPGMASGGPGDDTGRVAQSARISFTAKLGAHDLKAVEVLDRDFFSKWVMQFMESQQAVRATVKPEFAGLIDNYLKRNFAWFVFDSIAVTKEAESRRPIEYRFTCDHVFYPLEISSLQHGQTTIDLLVVTPHEFDSFEKVKSIQIEKGLHAKIKPSDLARVSGGWAAFMKSPEVHLQMLTMRGDLRDFNVDFIAKRVPE